MPQDRLLLRHYRFYTVTLLLASALYALLVILPFFAYGLHQQPAFQVAYGGFDPKGYPLYASPLGLVAFFVSFCGPIWMAVFGIVVALKLVRHWPRLSKGQRRFGAFAVFASASILVFMVTPLGKLIFNWLAD